MTNKKYSDEKAIKVKIQQLFAYRKLTDLLQLSQLDKNKTFSKQLIDIQYHIYLLDAYLEGRWELEKAELKKYWTGIYNALAQLNYNQKQTDSLLWEIREYERIEKNCRKNKWPTRTSIRKFYTTKSCDVRLIRHLLYEAQPNLNQTWSEDAWVYYDRITEINDDIADIHEDLDTFNGNRFLISILRKGSEQTFRAYRRYLLKVGSKAKDYFKSRREEGNNQQLLEWTLVRLKETLELLEHTIQTTEPELYSSSLLLEHME